MFNEIDFTKIDLTGQPPADETKRQYYFMGKIRELLARESAVLGRPVTYCLQTFGCQMNEKQSEVVAGIMDEMGFDRKESEDADIVIYNTCTVRENANLKVYGRLGKLHNLKKHNPDMKIILFGCMMQEPHVVDKIRNDYPFVDLVFGTHNIFRFAELFYEMKNRDSQLVEIWEGTEQIVEELPTERNYSFKSGVNIMFGCNNFCSYCIVPYVRGRERSREPEAIVNEVKSLVADGVTEVMLLGQNVNSYGKTLEHPVTFAQLLQMVEAVPGLHRIRFMTSHPKDLSDELIEYMGKSKKVCHHLHLPMQSGSSRILKLMNRRYDKEKYLELVQKIRGAVPDISLTTDIIVGFPGETEEDFLETLDVVDKSNFDTAFTFIYSKRSGTPAAKMEDQVPEDVVKDRFDRLLSLVQEKGRMVSSRFQGTVQEVLVETESKEKGIFTGRTQYNLLVHFPGTSDMLGKYIQVRLDTCKGFYYLGTAVTEQE
ncbi:tRNA (N6-isopentenyl adenosine(37)-C2)-methylthiotransferase MiaB [Blautia ammoniilytica]|uniref:tRNA-2-methylthio-N(6)-dimethylallyladenosine synthase n=1 Tax=Blautia ammoniilytica TaxID=2981782 RepID=A0ABT2TTS2_9FIRM|nr:tRNA (N6-isopentenyl adenosine(37)-C2)-methylthiotransferase MiaB [Blautia ammoniilytica]MCU6764849.1 tRNA (N6-isopentenyl adenosine(37)-C2)-methylthiotransferase MiaB [Blautia ammoniilytica]SCH67048.1 (Dimethylallyl)adenosine tRNA methylthiotransferase MiaB [uncultured Blautia sp.]